nr:hypothetical protein [uncultured Selenomonas sp.]
MHSIAQHISNFKTRTSRNIPADADRTRADLTNVDGQSVKRTHARLVDDLRRRAVLPKYTPMKILMCVLISSAFLCAAAQQVTSPAAKLYKLPVFCTVLRLTCLTYFQNPIQTCLSYMIRPPTNIFLLWHSVFQLI